MIDQLAHPKLISSRGDREKRRFRAKRRGLLALLKGTGIKEKKVYRH